MGRASLMLALVVSLALILRLNDAAVSNDPIGVTYAQAGLPSVPSGWPGSLQLGMASPPGDAATLRSTAAFGFRYQYLSGGVNTGGGWATWDANGSFVTAYIDESFQNSTIPVFTYYMLLQSNPASGADEGAKVYNNLQNTATMTSYYKDLKLFFQKAGAYPGKMVVLHVEPDLWGYMQQRISNDNATTVPAKVGSTDLSEVAGLPDNLSGFARAIVKLRDTYASNVVLAYSLSIWGTNNDISIDDPSDVQVDALATRAGNFYRSLAANYDIVFGEFSDRDSAFKIAQWGAGPEAWWDTNDFRRHVRFNAKFVSVAQKRLVLWQIPFGNTKMRAMNNTWGHYQDNRPEWLLDDPTRAHLNDYVQAGVVAFLFGSGAEGATCACDAAGDGVTDPASINGNTIASYSADDDGGFFRQRAKAYYTAGTIALPNGSSSGTPTAIAVRTQTPTSTATPPASVTLTPTATKTPAATLTNTPAKTPAATPTPPAAPGFTTTAQASQPSIARGQTISISSTVTSTSAMTALVDVEIYGPDGTLARQKWFDNQRFVAGQQRSYTVSWTVPTTARTGTYTVSIGIFGAGDWDPLYDWRDNVTQFSVT